jgi:type VI secretion system secreted protein Hcp
MTMTKSGDGQLAFLTITLKEVYIANVSVSAVHGGDVSDSVTLSYGDIEFAYQPQQADGSMGGEIKFGWDTRTTETR